MAATNRHIVRREWFDNPRCRVCGMPTTRQKKFKSTHDPHTATRGHLYSRFDIRRYLQPDEWQLECFKCNDLRQREENVFDNYRKAHGHWKDFPELLICLAETEDNSMYLVPL